MLQCCAITNLFTQDRSMCTQLHVVSSLHRTKLANDRRRTEYRLSNGQPQKWMSKDPFFH